MVCPSGSGLVTTSPIAWFIRRPNGESEVLEHLGSHPVVTFDEDCHTRELGDVERVHRDRDQRLVDHGSREERVTRQRVQLAPSFELLTPASSTGEPADDLRTCRAFRDDGEIVVTGDDREALFNDSLRRLEGVIAELEVLCRESGNRLGVADRGWTNHELWIAVVKEMVLHDR